MSINTEAGSNHQSYLEKKARGEVTVLHGFDAGLGHEWTSREKDQVVLFTDTLAATTTPRTVVDIRDALWAERTGEPVTVGEFRSIIGVAARARCSLDADPHRGIVSKPATDLTIFSYSFGPKDAVIIPESKSKGRKKTQVNRKKHSQPYDEMVAALTRKGLGIGTIAEQLGLSRSSIENARTRLYASGKLARTIREITTLKPTDIPKIVALRAQRVSNREISTQLHVSLKNVERTVAQLIRDGSIDRRVNGARTNKTNEQDAAGKRNH